jgi:hypothetical protein
MFTVVPEFGIMSIILLGITIMMMIFLSSKNYKISFRTA